MIKSIFYLALACVILTSCNKESVAVLEAEARIADSEKAEYLSHLPEVKNSAQKFWEWTGASEYQVNCEMLKRSSLSTSRREYYQKKCSELRSKYGDIPPEEVKETLFEAWKKSIWEMGHLMHSYKKMGYAYSMEDWHEARRIAHKRMYKKTRGKDYVPSVKP